MDYSTNLNMITALSFLILTVSATNVEHKQQLISTECEHTNPEILSVQKPKKPDMTSILTKHMAKKWPTIDEPMCRDILHGMIGVTEIIQQFSPMFEPDAAERKKFEIVAKESENLFDADQTPSEFLKAFSRLTNEKPMEERGEAFDEVLVNKIVEEIVEKGWKYQMEEFKRLRTKMDVKTWLEKMINKS